MEGKRPPQVRFVGDEDEAADARDGVKLVCGGERRQGWATGRQGWQQVRVGEPGGVVVFGGEGASSSGYH